MQSSFLGRASSHSIPSSHKQRSSTVRSFIFERDDSNSRSSVSIMSEDSSDTVSVVAWMNKKALLVVSRLGTYLSFCFLVVITTVNYISNLFLTKMQGSRESQKTRNHTAAKYSKSQQKCTRQSRDGDVETLSRTSLLEILKRSSSKSQLRDEDTTVDLTKSIFKIQGRT